MLGAINNEDFRADAIMGQMEGRMLLFDFYTLQCSPVHLKTVAMCESRRVIRIATRSTKDMIHLRAFPLHLKGFLRRRFDFVYVEFGKSRIWTAFVVQDGNAVGAGRRIGHGDDEH